MLQGMESYDIIVGAYTDRHGGVCPMLAAHRCGGRTDFISFARAWDGFTGARARARRATERELRVLRTHLEASLFEDEAVDFETVIAEYVARRDGRRRELARPGDPDRSRELAGREGWRWLVPFRRLDDYERALARVEAAERDAAPATDEREPAPV
jgi:hypothetical protein